MTDRELEAAVPDLRHDPKRTFLAFMLLALIGVVLALAAFGLHSYLSPSPIYR